MSASGPGDGTGQGVIYVPPGGGRVYEQGGLRGAIKVDNEESGGRQCFSEWTVDAGEDGPPPHVHRQHQEAFFVVEGMLSFRAGEETIEAEAGSFIFIPAGVVHAFSNRTNPPPRQVRERLRARRNRGVLHRGRRGACRR
jgi:quercetin dioxygenase-like cupin family protein